MDRKGVGKGKEIGIAASLMDDRPRDHCNYVVVANITRDTDEDIQHQQTNDCNCKLHPTMYSLHMHRS